MKDIGQAHKADISSFIGGIVYGSAETLYGVGGVTNHPPVEGGNVEEHPIRTILCRIVGGVGWVNFTTV